MSEKYWYWQRFSTKLFIFVLCMSICQILEINRSKCRVSLPELRHPGNNLTNTALFGDSFTKTVCHMRVLIIIQFPEISYRASSSHRDISYSCCRFERIKKCYRYLSCRATFAERPTSKHWPYRRYTFHCAEQCSIDDVVVSTCTSVHISLDSKVVLKRSVSLVNADLAFNSSRQQKVEIYQR